MRESRNDINLTKEILSPTEQYYLASNLNAIERERERQKNPDRIDYFFWMIGGIMAIPFIIYAAFDLIYRYSSVLSSIIIIAVALVAMYIAILFIKAVWILLHQ